MFFFVIFKMVMLATILVLFLINVLNWTEYTSCCLFRPKKVIHWANTDLKIGRRLCLG